MSDIRERLYEIISQTIIDMTRETANPNINYDGTDICSRVADALIAAGVVLPKFKPGQEEWNNG